MKSVRATVRLSGDYVEVLECPEEPRLVGRMLEAVDFETDIHDGTYALAISYDFSEEGLIVLFRVPDRPISQESIDDAVRVGSLPPII